MHNALACLTLLKEKGANIEAKGKVSLASSSVCVCVVERDSRFMSCSMLSSPLPPLLPTWVDFYHNVCVCVCVVCVCVRVCVVCV